MKRLVPTFVPGLVLLLMAGCQKKETSETATQPRAEGRTRIERPAARKPVARLPGRQATRHARPSAPTETGPRPRVELVTNMGRIVVELYPDKAPISVKNFLRYVKEKFYDGTIFHRVVPGFVIQGGGFTKDLQKKPTHEPIKNEADNGLKNLRGTIAMARTMVVDSATSQFYINLKDNPGLDHRGTDPRRYGYAVFGKVVEGMDVVDKIAQVPTGACGPLPKSCPQKPVIIERARILPSQASQGEPRPPKAARPAGPKVRAVVRARLALPRKGAPRTGGARTTPPARAR